tara:strand:- start:946 stop:1176 length:231 start_codon:yes stop_codon:yes gene_type:complete
VAKKRNDKKDSAIERLMGQPIEVMEKVLENASKKDVPIEVDGVVFYIPKPVSDLIDHLAVQAGLDEPKKDIEPNEA